MKIEKNTKSTRRTETTLRTERYGIESTEKRGVLLAQGEENMKSKKNGKGNWYIIICILISLSTLSHIYLQGILRSSSVVKLYTQLTCITHALFVFNGMKFSDIPERFYGLDQS